MGQRCTICKHINRLEIDKLIIQGQAHTEIAKMYGVHNMAVRGHAENHLSRQLLTAHDIKERANASMLLDEIYFCLSKAKGVLTQAELDNKPALQLQAIIVIQKTIEFLSKLAIAQATLAQERELALHDQSGSTQKTIIFLPKKEAIEPSMSARQACDRYIAAIRISKENPGAEIKYEDEQDEQPEPTMTRTKPAKQSSAERVKKSAQDSPDEDYLDILNWKPTIPPKPNSWPGSRI